METALVTGAAGFLGRYVCAALAGEFHVVGCGRAAPRGAEPFAWHEVRVDAELADVVRECRPDIVVHAAFVNRKPERLSDGDYLQQTLRTNYLLGEAIRETRARLVLVSSSAVYGNGLGSGLIDESCPLRPVSLYGLAKQIQEAVLTQCATRGISMSVVRMFNLCGPGQARGMLLPDWVSQAAAIIGGQTSQFRVRHLRTSRDFVDVRDAAQAIALLCAVKTRDEVVNVATGRDIALSEILMELERLCGVRLNVVETERQPAPADVQCQAGSFERIKTRYGWEPKITWQQSLAGLWMSYRTQTHTASAVPTDGVPLGRNETCVGTENGR